MTLVDTTCYDRQYGATCGTVSYLNENWNSPVWGIAGVNGADANPNFVNLANDDVHIAINDPTIVGNGQPGIRPTPQIRRQYPSNIKTS